MVEDLHQSNVLVLQLLMDVLLDLQDLQVNQEMMENQEYQEKQVAMEVLELPLQDTILLKTV